MEQKTIILLSCLVGILLIPFIFSNDASAAVQLDANNFTASTGAVPNHVLSHSITIGNHQNRLLLVMVHYNSNVGVVTGVTDTKTYDGGVTSDGEPTVGDLVAGDTVNAAPTQVYDDKNQGTTHVMTPSGLTIKDALDADMTGNYTITYTPSAGIGTRPFGADIMLSKISIAMDAA